MRISVDEARAYFEHGTQQRAAKITPDALPGDPFQYWAAGGVCGCFHPDHWPGVWMAHYGVMPVAWGSTLEPARAILSAFWDENAPEMIIGWTDSSNRQAVKFARRLGFKVLGEMVLRDSTVIMQGWTKC